MFRQIQRLVILLHLISIFLLPASAGADSVRQPAYQMSVYDLINAVNELRVAYGLAPYSINSILMFTAQNQADFMALTGQVTHSGPGGITLTQRLLAAGYPLSGDLSLGGFRAENITSGNEGMQAESAIHGWMRDAPHQNTMLSPNLTEIGAGVAVANGRVYLVIDAARPIDAPNLPAQATSVVGSGTIVPAFEAPISPVILSTPNAMGEVVHEVQYGQSLWQLAISYGVKIDDIKRLNSLFDNSIYPGNKLLIKIESTRTPVPSTVTSLPVTTVTPTAIMTATLPPTSTTTMIPSAPIDQSSNNAMTWAVAIMVVAIFGAGAVAWWGVKSQAAKSR